MLIDNNIIIKRNEKLITENLKYRNIFLGELML